MVGENSKITFTVAKETVATTYKKVLQSFVATTAAPGFRKGKAPVEIVESIVGKLKLLEKTFEKVAPTAYYEAVVAAKRHPITNPEFNPLKLDMDADWEIEAFFAERPEIKLGEYQKVTAAAIKTAEVEIATAKKASETEAKSVAKKTADNAGEKVAAPAPKPTPTEEQQKAMERETKLKHIFQSLVTSIKPIVPEMLVRQETRYELDNLMRQLDQFGLKLEHYLAKRQITTEALSQELAATALSRLQLELVLGKIAGEHKLTASHEEVDKVIGEVKDEKLRAQLHENAEYRQQIEASIIRQKVIDLLLQ